MTAVVHKHVHSSEIRTLWQGDVVDCDIHINTSFQLLWDYLAPQWREFITDRFLPRANPIGLRRVYPPDSPFTTMAKWLPDDGTLPASTLSLVRDQIIDPLGSSYAVINCYYAVDSIRHPDFAAAVASAINDWVREKWLEEDDRFRASIVTPARDPEAAAREIRRVAGHPGFVQVLLPVRADRPYGSRSWYPLMQAAVDHDLVLGVHYGGTSEAAPTSTGTPNYYLAENVGEIGVFWAQLTSMIGEGLFQQFPTLRVSMLEGGFTWLPSLWWRLAKDWKGLRREIPWVDRNPIEIIREHFRFSTAPLDTSSREELAASLAYLGKENLLMFATDYPHFHDDDMAILFGVTESALQQQIMSDTARTWYRLPYANSFPSTSKRGEQR